MQSLARELQQQRYWVFDMDGTLTEAIHDFPGIRRSLGIPPEADILAYLASLPREEAEVRYEWLSFYEKGMAERARAAPGAVELIHLLRERGCRIGILTRNLREMALRTLQVIGLRDCFNVADIVGRMDAYPKPHPQGLMHLALRWKTLPPSLVMVGDFQHDLACARAAGSRSILVNHIVNPWPELTDLHALDCRQLYDWLQTDWAQQDAPGLASA